MGNLLGSAPDHERNDGDGRIPGRSVGSETSIGVPGGRTRRSRLSVCTGIDYGRARPAAGRGSDSPFSSLVTKYRKPLACGTLDGRQKRRDGGLDGSPCLGRRRRCPAHHHPGKAGCVEVRERPSVPSPGNGTGGRVAKRPRAFSMGFRFAGGRPALSCFAWVAGVSRASHPRPTAAGGRMAWPRRPRPDRRCGRHFRMVPASKYGIFRRSCSSPRSCRLQRSRVPPTPSAERDVPARTERFGRGSDPGNRQAGLGRSHQPRTRTTLSTALPPGNERRRK